MPPAFPKDTILKEFAFKTPMPSSRKRLIFHKMFKVVL